MNDRKKVDAIEKMIRRHNESKTWRIVFYHEARSELTGKEEDFATLSEIEKRKVVSRFWDAITKP